MKKLTISILAFVSFFTFLASQDRSQSAQLQLVVEGNGASGMEVKIVTPPLQQRIEKTEAGEFLRVFADGMIPNGLPGGPELPVLRRMIEVPLGANPELAFEETGRQMLNLSTLSPYRPLYPFQPSASKSPDSIFRFHYNPGLYQSETQHTSVRVTELGILRDSRLFMLEIAPYTYDNDRRMIHYPSELKIRIVFRDADMTATRSMKERLGSPMFQIPSDLLLGGSIEAKSKDVLSRYPITYVIVSDPMFQAQLQPFIAWKKKKGFKVIEAYTNNPAVGTTTTTIKSYLAGLYNNATPENPAPTYLLIVGDVAQVPAFTGTTGSHVTDLYYAEYTGDKMPELYYGRFSASTVADLQPQIDKTLQYEQYLMPDPSFLGKAVMVSGVDQTWAPTHGNGQINYGTTYYFNTSHGIYSHTYLYPASASSASLIRQHVSDGVGYANYTAHGGASGWSDPSFTTSHIPALANTGKYPLMVGNACLTNRFQDAACFGEALLRASGKGAIGYIGASNNTYWNEDFYWGVGLGSVSANPTYAATGLGAYDRTFHDHGEPYSEWYVTQGQMIHAGNLAVTASASSYVNYYWEVYHLMGDPSLMVYFGVPQTLTISHSGLIAPMATTFAVQTEPYTYIALSKGGVLHGAGLADSTGYALLTIDPFLTSGQADIVATRQNRQPYVSAISVMSPAGPYVIAESLFASGSGNGNQIPEYNENVSLSVRLTNAGMQSSSNLVVVLSSSDPYVRILDSVQVHSGLLPSASDTLLSAFSVEIAPCVPDQHLAAFQISVRSAQDTLDFVRTLAISAPVLTMTAAQVIDSTGNGNGMADPGETLTLRWTFLNEGQADASQFRLKVVPLTPYVHFPSVSTYASIHPHNTSLTLDQPAYMSASAPLGYRTMIQVILETDSCIYLIDTIEVRIGRSPVVVIDLDPNTSSGPAITQAIQDNGVQVDYVTSVPANLSPYQAAFVCLGIYSQNHQLTQSQGTTLASFLNSGGRLYMEGGDTWAYDPKTPVHNMFYINGLGDGAADLSTIAGVASTFTTGMSFIYNGEENWIDRIAPTGSAFTIFNNSSPAYTTGVAFANATYKTIGVSHEFSGMSNGTLPSTRVNLMKEYLTFFGLVPSTLIPGFTATPTVLCPGDTTMFVNTTAGSVVSYYWTFEGGIPAYSEQAAPSVTWTQPGNYQVSLTVSNGLQAFTHTTPAMVTVMPDLQISQQPSDATASTGDTVSFTAVATYPSTLQWFVSTDNGSSWTQLQNGAGIAGVATQTLVLSSIASNMNGNLYKCQFLGGCPEMLESAPARLTVTPQGGIQGRLFYAGIDSLAMKGLTIGLEDSSGALFTGLTNNQGWYDIPLATAGTYGTQLQGPTGWGGVNSSDALQILKHFVGVGSLNGLRLKAGDVDNSGFVNSTDALLTSKRFVGVVTSFPAGDWVVDPGTVNYNGGTAQQHIGMLYTGDVDASFVPQAKGQSDLMKNAAVAFTPGQTIELPVYITSSELVHAVSMVLPWPSTWVLRDVLVHAPSAANLAWLQESSELRLGWFSLEHAPSAENEAFVTLILDVLEPASGFISQAEYDIAGFDGRTIHGAILKMDYPEPVMAWFGNPYPNPSTGMLRWPVASPAAGKAMVEVFDLAGRRALLEEVTLQSGLQEIAINLNIPAGAYTAVLTMEMTDGPRSTSKRLLIAR